MKERTKLYNSWKGMKERCHNPKHKDYHSYGGKGIKVCALFQRYDSFEEWAKNNGYRNGLTIDRINNDADYCPENCRWSTHAEQSLNTSKNLIVNINGEEKPLILWVQNTNLNYGTVRSRYRNGIRGETLLSPITRYSVKLVKKRRCDYGIKKGSRSNNQQGKLREDEVCFTGTG
jgi:hypothetical protein